MYVYVYINEWEKQSHLFARYILLSFTEASSKTAKYRNCFFHYLFLQKTSLDGFIVLQLKTDPAVHTRHI